jgi:hypothetical protein
MSGELEGGSIPILKTLVDSLANTLLKLSVRQETIEKDMGKIEIATANLPEIKRMIEEIRIENKKQLEILLEAKKEYEAGIKTLRDNIEPITKLSNLLRQPLAIVVFVITLIGAALGLIKIYNDLYAKTIRTHNIPQNISNVNTNNTTP